MKNIFVLLIIISSSLALSSENTEKKDVTQSSPVLAKNIEIDKIPEINITIKEPINWYMLSLPFITISLVIGSTIISIRTIRIKTNESMEAFSRLQEAQKEISEAQTRVTIISESRQKWINTLREELSIFISLLHEMEHMLHISGDRPSTESSNEYLTLLISKIELRSSKITLLINPTEEDHINLIKLIEKSITTHGEGLKNLYTITNEIIVLSQKILKDEWEVVKALK